jgi:thiosulfate dehydrogenase [quinone] large subunit
MAIETQPRPRAPQSTRPHIHQGLRTRPRRLPHVHVHLPRRRAASSAALATLAAPSIALIGLELLVGYEWLVSGVDKLLIGTFPSTLGGLLTQSLSGGQLPGFFAAILRGLVAPNAVPFGYLIEWGEILAGLGLIAAALTELACPWVERHWPETSRGIFTQLVRLLDVLTPLAAAGAGLLGLSFFFLDGLPKPWFTPTIAYGGAIDTGLFLAAASVVIVASRLARGHA